MQQRFLLQMCVRFAGCCNILQTRYEPHLYLVYCHHCVKTVIWQYAAELCCKYCGLLQGILKSPTAFGAIPEALGAEYIFEERKNNPADHFV